MEVTSKQIAEYLDAPHEGDVIELEDVNGINLANSDELSFYIYDDLIDISSDAGVVITTEDATAPDEMTIIRHSNPRFGFLKATNEFFKGYPRETKIHETATVASGADIGDQCRIGPHVHIGSNVEIGDQCDIGAGTIIGGDPVGIVNDEEYQMVQHKCRGGVQIGDRVEIGQNCCINRSVFNETTIGDECVFDDLIHIGQNTDVEKRVWISCNVSVSGQVTIETGARINPNASIGEYVTVGEGATVGMNSTVLDDVSQNIRVAGTPASEI